MKTNFWYKPIKILNLFKAFFIRDLKIFISYRLNFFFQLFSIIVIMAFIFFGVDLTDASSKQKVASYLMGIALIDFMLSCISVFSREVRLAQQFGTFEILLISKTPIFLIIFSNYIFTLIRTSSRIFIYMIICSLLFELGIALIEIPIIILFIMFSSLPFIGIGLISASFMIIFKQGNFINAITSLIAIFLSGILFPLNNLPTFLKPISESNPLKLSIEIIYDAILDNRALSWQDFYQNFENLFFISFYLMLIGVLLVYYSVKLSKKNGSLNHY